VSAVELLHEAATEAETSIAAEARTKFLAEYKMRPDDLMDGGAALRERVVFAQQAAEQKASDEDGARRAATIAFNSLADAYTTVQAEVREMLPSWLQTLENLGQLRAAYEAAQGTCVALKCEDVPRRINSLAVDAALNDRELQLTINGLSAALQSNL
jgi:hypothetical protein